MKASILVVIGILLTTLAYSQNFEGRKKINGCNLFLSVKGKGDYLLVIHGGPGLNHSYFIPHLTALENDFRIIYYDQRACGQSSIPSPDSISLKFLADDIEGIRKNFGIEKLNILAHSWGALLAVQYGLRYPGRLNKIILSNPAMLSREYDREASLLVQKNSTSEDSVARAEILGHGTLGTKDYENLFLLSFKTSAYNKSNVAKINVNLPDNFGLASNALFSGLMKDPSMNSNFYDSLSSLKFPVLIVQGSADLIPLSSIQRLKENLPNATLEVFKQSGHFPFVEETALYNDSVRSFLKSDR